MDTRLYLCVNKNEREVEKKKSKISKNEKKNRSKQSSEFHGIASKSFEICDFSLFIALFLQFSLPLHIYLSLCLSNEWIKYEFMCTATAMKKNVFVERIKYRIKF